MGMIVNEVDKVEILTLQDNFVDIVTRDDNEMIRRAMPIKGMEIKNSILAEHGFASLVTVTKGERSRSILFDFGFSEHGAAFNAEALDADLTGVERLALSHGHLDHVGGLARLAGLVGRKAIELVLHPSAFRNPRYVKLSEDFKIYFPPFTREKAEAAGVVPIETREPLPLLDEDLIFLGEIPRKTDFEKGMALAHYEEDGVEKWDPIEDDTAIVANIKGRGLVVLTGCAHSGIVNTVNYARELTGIDRVMAVMGGFHLTGPEFEPIILATTQALKEIDPAYIVPTHCTGRKAVMHMENEMPDKFILNMSGTTLTFAA